MKYAYLIGVLALTPFLAHANCNSLSLGQPVIGGMYRATDGRLIVNGEISGFAKNGKEAYVRWLTASGTDPDFVSEWRAGKTSVSYGTETYTCDELIKNRGRGTRPFAN